MIKLFFVFSWIFMFWLRERFCERFYKAQIATLRKEISRLEIEADWHEGVMKSLEQDLKAFGITMARQKTTETIVYDFDKIENHANKGD